MCPVIQSARTVGLTQFLGLWCLECSLHLVGPVVEGLGSHLQAVQHGGQLVQGVAVAQAVARRRALAQLVSMLHTRQLVWNTTLSVGGGVRPSFTSHMSLRGQTAIHMSVFITADSYCFFSNDFYKR